MFYFSDFSQDMCMYTKERKTFLLERTLKLDMMSVELRPVFFCCL